jgi:hypothetical protein
VAEGGAGELRAGRDPDWLRSSSELRGGRPLDEAPESPLEAVEALERTSEKAAVLLSRLRAGETTTGEAMTAQGRLAAGQGSPRRERRACEGAW